MGKSSRERMLADDGIRSELTENQKKEEKLEARVGIEPTALQWNL